MRYLWSPWRMDYILRKKPKGCVFCKMQTEQKDTENFILHQGKYGFAVMNRFPYNNGHLMIVPKRHCLHLEQLDEKECKELWYLLKTFTRVLKATLHPDGLNIGINIGKAGGAGEEHIHIHIVPRWIGDTNFMPVLGETRMIPQYLEETYQKLESAFRDFLKGGERGKGGRKR